MRMGNVQQIFCQGDFWVHLFPSVSDSQSSGFYKVPPVFPNICPAISMQLLVCNLQLFTAGNASRLGVTDAFESCWESCCSLAPCFHPRRGGGGICVQEDQPCQVIHWQEQGANPTWPDSPDRAAGASEVWSRWRGCFSIPASTCQMQVLLNFKSRRDHCELLVQERQSHLLVKCHLSTAPVHQSPALYHKLGTLEHPWEALCSGVPLKLILGKGCTKNT